MEPADALRSVETLATPDPRMARNLGHESALALRHRHEAIESLQLAESVPEHVRIHFETGKNLLLYAWFVYRFHMVAEQHVLATLEFALRERVEGLGLVTSETRPKGLSHWMRRAAAAGLIDNARFELGLDFARERAEHRFTLALHKKMQDEGLTELEYDPAQIEVRPEDHLDWISLLAEQLPKLRNIHAHGSSMLYPAVFRNFRVVANLIDQAYEGPPAPGTEPVTRADAHLRHTL